VGGARWLLYRTAEDFGLSATARPQSGQGRLERRRARHTHVSTKRRARKYDAVIRGRRGAGPTDEKPREHPPTSRAMGWGRGSPSTGAHETAPGMGCTATAASPTAARRCASGAGRGGEERLNRGRARRERRPVVSYVVMTRYCSDRGHLRAGRWRRPEWPDRQPRALPVG